MLDWKILYRYYRAICWKVSEACKMFNIMLFMMLHYLNELILAQNLLHYLSFHIEGILPKGPYLPCVSLAGRALLAGYHRYVSKHETK